MYQILRSVFQTKTNIMRGFRGNRNNRGFSHKKNFHQRESSWQTEERLQETDVGITRYVNNTEGFQALIKARFSDFQVNEVDINGSVAILTDFSVPAQEEPQCEEGLQIRELLSEDKVNEINDLIEKSDYHKSVLIDVSDFDKEKRSDLHKVLRKEYGRKTTNNTITTEAEKKYIQIKKFSKGDHEGLRGWNWPAEYTHFIMYKENIDTIHAISLLAKNLKIKPSYLNYAGTKDKRAKTSQWISLWKTEPQKIAKAARASQGIKVGNFKFMPKPLRLGDLKGNRFRIALRSINCDEEHIEKILESVSKYGFLNLYGLQRFGNCREVPTYCVGQALLKSDFKEAVDLILKERDGDPPFLKKMRETWKSERDAKKALSFSRDQRNINVEAKLLHALAKHTDKKYNYLQALLTLPRNMLLLYVHSYQSLLFNKAVSKRRDLGLEVIVGDLVFKENSNEAEVLIEEGLTDEIDADSCEKSDQQEEEGEDSEKISKYKNMVQALTKEDVESGKYSIFDIVLPLPGHDITFPSNEVAQVYYKLLEDDGLSPGKLKNNHKTFSLCGAYRKVFTKPKDFTWRFMKYDNQNDDLLLSDYSRMMKDPEIVSKPDGKNTALILEFEVPQSTYATMLLREILKIDTSASTQMKLQNDLNAAAKSNEKSTETKDGGSENAKRSTDGASDNESKRLRTE